MTEKARKVIEELNKERDAHMKNIKFGRKFTHKMSKHNRQHGKNSHHIVPRHHNNFGDGGLFFIKHL